MQTPPPVGGIPACRPPVGGIPAWRPPYWVVFLQGEPSVGGKGGAQSAASHPWGEGGLLSPLPLAARTLERVLGAPTAPGCSNG